MASSPPASAGSPHGISGNIEARFEPNRSTSNASQFLAGQVPHTLRHVPEVRAHDLLAQAIHQGVELLLRARVDEPIVRELLELAGHVRRERIEEGLTHPCVVPGLERERGSFALDDPLELLPDLLERPLEVQRALLAATALAKPRPQCVEPTEPSLHSTAHQSRERALRPRAGEDVVGKLLQQLGCRDVGTERILRVVPARVAELPHRLSVRASRRKTAALGAHSWGSALSHSMPGRSPPAPSNTRVSALP